MADYLPLLLMFLLATFFAFASFIASGLLAPKRRTIAKEAPYECGIVPSREPAERFPVRFYLVAMIFIVFDIEIVFVYPWAVIFDKLGLFGLIEMIVFALAVVVSFAYLIANGALDWGPAKVLKPLNKIQTGTTVSARTSDTTIRRIGNAA
jgi:NADH-quinone oxidoreductase subunit A